jgi:hypothetical protein
MLPRSEIAFFDCALVRQAPLAFQEEFLILPAAKPANCLSISCQTNLPVRTRPRPPTLACVSADGIRCAEWASCP